MSRGGQLKKMQMQLRDEIALKVKDIQENPSGLFELNEEIARIKERQRMRLLGHMAGTNNFIAENVLTIDRHTLQNRDTLIQRRGAEREDRLIEAA